MKLKLFTIITLLIFVAQIGYSIFYSIKIVDENILINQLQNQLIDSTINHQNKKFSLAQQNSIETILNIATMSAFIKVNSTLDLR